MHQGVASSPIFDMPEFPALRRIKPLPKRRRTSSVDLSSSEALFHAGEIEGATNGIPPNLALPTLSPSLGLEQQQLPDASPEELLAQAEQLSTQMALQSYYMPILGNVKELLKTYQDDLTIDGATGKGGGGGTMSSNKQARFDALASSIEDLENTLGRDDLDDDGDRDRDGDYSDHLRQPGNNKKRKVPANASASPHLHNRGGGSSNSGGEEDTIDGDGRLGVENGGSESVLSSLNDDNKLSSTSGTTRKGKLTPATFAGLQHKEMLKTRKRQLAAVLGALSHGDTLALDQALSSSYPSPATGGMGFDDRNLHPPQIRLSRRKGPRIARVFKKSMLPRHPDSAAFPACEFSFYNDSATSKRVIATKEEVATLRKRFEAELSRQAAKAAKLAAANRLAASSTSRRSKRSERAKQRARHGGKAASDDQPAEFLDPSGTPTKPRGKKKKRSALANASNPHHLRNYVPSRLPHSSSPLSTNQLNALNEMGPFPIRFLSAEIPPRRDKKVLQPVQPTSQLANPAEEWICAFCEYELFYGDGQEYRRAIRNRKKILRRRRRARERAAAAASGNSAAAARNGGNADGGDDESSEEEYGDGYDDAPAEFAPMPPPPLKDPGLQGNLGRAGDLGSFG